MPSLVPTLPAGVMSDAQELKKGTTFSSSLNEKIDKVEEEKFLVPQIQQPVQETPEDLVPSPPRGYSISIWGKRTIIILPIIGIGGLLEYQRKEINGFRHSLSSTVAMLSFQRLLITFFGKTVTCVDIISKNIPENNAMNYVKRVFLKEH